MGVIWPHDGKMAYASNQMARNFDGAIARAWRICSELGIKNRKHAKLWGFKSSHSLQAYIDAKFGIQIFSHSNLLQPSPRPPCLPSLEALGCETKHEYTLPTRKRDMSAAPVLQLVPLCCTLLDQLIDNQGPQG